MRKVFRCCDLAIWNDEPNALERIRVHIHMHRLGTPDTADECPECTRLATVEMSGVSSWTLIAGWSRLRCGSGINVGG
jgi:hypothetical protein